MILILYNAFDLSINICKETKDSIIGKGTKYENINRPIKQTIIIKERIFYSNVLLTTYRKNILYDKILF